MRVNRDFSHGIFVTNRGRIVYLRPVILTAFTLRHDEFATANNSFSRVSSCLAYDRD